MVVVQKAKKSKKQRKHGRSNRSGQVLRYKNEHRRDRNKLRRLKKHLSRFGDDKCAAEAVSRCKAILGIR